MHLQTYHVQMFVSFIKEEPCHDPSKKSTTNQALTIEEKVQESREESIPEEEPIQAHELQPKTHEKKRIEVCEASTSTTKLRVQA